MFTDLNRRRFAAWRTVLLLSIITCLTSVTATGATPTGYPPVTDRVTPTGYREPLWKAPVAPPLVVGDRFDPPHQPWLTGHRGVDLCPGIGSTVRSPRQGVVVWAGTLVDRPVISIQHEDGLRSTFEPVVSSLTVGETVQTGQVLGQLTSGHRHDCLHWGVKEGKHDYLNPLRLLLGRPRLLPQ